MATGGETSSELQRDWRLRLAQIKGSIFEALLVFSTLIGILSLLVLFGYISFDAFRPMTASVRWYLVYFGTLVGPMSLYVLYTRYNDAVRRVNAKTFAVFLGGLASALVTYVIVTALSPYDVLVFLFFGAVPAVLVHLYGDRYLGKEFVGPAVPVVAVVGILSVFGVAPVIRFLVGTPIVLVEGLTGINIQTTYVVYALGVGTPVVAVVGYARRTGRSVRPAVVVATAALAFVLTEGLYGHVRPLVGFVPEPVAYFTVVAVPVAVIIRTVVGLRRSGRSANIAAALVAVAAVVAAVAAFAVGVPSPFWIVVSSAFVAPFVYVIGDTVLSDEEGRLGVLGPFVVVGGILLGAYLVRVVGVRGPETFLTPNLLVNSWNGLNAANAGVYPQIVGSIVIVGFMSFLAFPVGVGAAVYLEEYAPKTGWWGRIAKTLELNISNLAGVPSVVYGLLGLALFRNTLGLGTGVVVAASGTLGLLILPIVVVSAQEAVRSVPDSLREASYGMGASRWQTVRNIVLPEAVPGILTGTILALARAIGETAPLVMIAVATTTYSAPRGLFDGATALPLQIFAARSNPDPAFRHGVVPAAAVVLLALMLIMNAVAIVVRNRYQREEQR